jgi:hypothetical protein
MKHFMLASVLTLAAVSFAAAEDRPAQRQKNQQHRIHQGVRSGELTGKEAAKLEAKEAKLHKEIRRDRQDGPGLTDKERVKIEKKQDKLSREIAKEKHDRQDR